MKLMNMHSLPRQRDRFGNLAGMAALSPRPGMPSAMKIVILTLCFGTILLLAHFEPPERGQLFRRLFALRALASRRNRQTGL